MRDRGHEGIEISRRELSALAKRVYSAYAAEWLRRFPKAVELPPVWSRLRPSARASWIHQVRTAVYGGKLTHPDEWVNELIRNFISQEIV